MTEPTDAETFEVFPASQAEALLRIDECNGMEWKGAVWEGSSTARMYKTWYASKADVLALEDLGFVELKSAPIDHCNNEYCDITEAGMVKLWLLYGDRARDSVNREQNRERRRAQALKKG